MIEFHGTDTRALTGTETLIAVANMIAVAMRGRADRRDRLLSRVMQGLIVKEGDNICFNYGQFCDHIASERSNQNNVLLRKTSNKAVKRKIGGAHLRRLGLETQHAYGDLMVVITPSFQEDADKIPQVFKKVISNRDFDMTENVIDMKEILDAGMAVQRRAG